MYSIIKFIKNKDGYSSFGSDEKKDPKKRKKGNTLKRINKFLLF